MTRLNDVVPFIVDLTTVHLTISTMILKMTQIHHFVFRYFRPILPMKYYKHLQMLAIAMSLAESNCLGHETIEIIDILLQEFDRLFPSLYSVS